MAESEGSDPTTSGRPTPGGGTKTNADYIQLPNGLLSSLTDATIEVWATPITVQNWARIFDFGTDTNNNLLIAWTQGTNINNDRVAYKVGDETRDEIPLDADDLAHAEPVYETLDGCTIPQVGRADPLARDSCAIRVARDRTYCGSRNSG